MTDMFDDRYADANMEVLPYSVVTDALQVVIQELAPMSDSYRGLTYNLLNDSWQCAICDCTASAPHYEGSLPHSWRDHVREHMKAHHENLPDDIKSVISLMIVTQVTDLGSKDLSLIDLSPWHEELVAYCKKESN